METSTEKEAGPRQPAKTKQSLWENHGHEVIPVVPGVGALPIIDNTGSLRLKRVPLDVYKR